ncbi:TetR/AcrR family transcriptional regulator [Streptomyces sp. NPDC056987]|uniref:TetR/AcrR family transcriptional regulator n=1 Tax=Streptomyces sp. NPDC056987 TaxID=3345988 RepID=UPI0036416914
MARTGGRIRNAEAHKAVLTAATELLEECGYQAITIEGVAERSGVAKSTIYRWWRSKPDLVMEAYTALVARIVPEPDTGSLATDLTEFAQHLHTGVRHPPRRRALRGLMAEAQLDPAFEGPFRAWVKSRREVVLRILLRARERGEIRPGADLDLAVDQIFGVFWYRLLVDHLPLDPETAAGHIDQLLRGLTAQKAP